MVTHKEWHFFNSFYFHDVSLFLYSIFSLFCTHKRLNFFNIENTSESNCLRSSGLSIRWVILNLSRSLNLSRGSNLVGSTLNCFQFNLRFKPALNWNRFLADLSCGSNSLNSDTGTIFTYSNINYTNNNMEIALPS